MTQIGRHGARVFAATAVALSLSVVLASQAASPPRPQGRGQSPPDPAATVVVHDGSTAQLITSLGPRGRMDALRVPIPADNPISEAKVDLGRRLFSDPVLSKDRSVSCSTCHKPELAFSDGKPLAVGVFGRVGKRHSPSLVNRGLGRAQFWDGRAATLEELALVPFRDANELDLPPEEAIARLAADPSYSAAFQSAFGLRSVRGWRQDGADRRTAARPPGLPVARQLHLLSSRADVYGRGPSQHRRGVAG
jgi:mono/diheme cytochrome c family protein